MTDSTAEDAIGRVTRTSQIIVGSLIAGALTFLGIAFFVDLGTTVSVPLITYAAVAFTAVLLPVSLLVPGLLAARQRRSIAAGTWAASQAGNRPIAGISPEAIQTDTGKLAIVYMTQTTVDAAVNSGAANFAAIAYMIEKNPLALLLTLLLVGGIVVRFPTRHRVELWIDEQREKLILERQARS